MAYSEHAQLDVRNVSKRYGGVAAVTDVSLTVKRGEVVALVGDNGAGKSTLVKIISGVVTPDEGEIRCAGHDHPMRSSSDARAMGVQTVYQDLAICDNLDTIQNLFLGREIRDPWYIGRRLARGKMEAEAREVLKRLDVKIRDLNVPASFLSGGQRQSVAICRSILLEPKVVLLDEPTAALGVAQRKQVISLIERLRDQDRGVLLISHDLGDVQLVADRVVVLRLGRKVCEFERGAYSREDLVSAITGMIETRRSEGHASEGVELRV